MNPETRRQIASVIERRYRESGHDNIRQFHEKSGSMLSGQTFYRLLGDKEFNGNISPQVIIEIAYLAGCTKREIIDLLHLIGDRMWSKLITPDPEITRSESAVLSICRKVTEKDTSMWDRIADSLELVAMAAGIDCRNETARIKTAAA